MTLARPSDKKGQSSLPLLKKKKKKNGRETKSKSGAKGFWTPQLEPVPPLILSFPRIKEVPQFLMLQYTLREGWPQFLPSHPVPSLLSEILVTNKLHQLILSPRVPLK